MTGRETAILSIGEAMVELSTAPQDGLFRIGIAGDTLNTAWYLRKLLPPTWQVNYFSRVGTGEFSQRMVDFLKASGIGTDYVSRDPKREIGLYAISLKEGERSFSYWRDTSAAKLLADDLAPLQAALARHSIAYLSGITLAILTPAGKAHLLQALEAAKAQGLRVIFDTNLRPKLWQSREEMAEWITCAAAIADLVLPSFDDEAAYFGDTDSDATLARYLAAGAGQVVLKAGGHPIRYAGTIASGMIAGLAPETALDTTAAGDSFNAGFLAAYLQGRPFDAALMAGHALSRQVIRHHGALVEQAVIDAGL